MASRSKNKPLYAAPKCSADDCLYEAVSALGRAALASEVFHREPLAKQASLALSSYLTHCIPFAVPLAPRGPSRAIAPAAQASLLTHCVGEGLDAARTHRPALSSFLCGLFEHVPRVAWWQAYVARHRAARHWDFCCGPLSDFIVSRQCAPLIVPRSDVIDPSLPDAAVRTIVAARTLSASHLEALGPSIRSVLGEGLGSKGAFA
jgi:hypothetical protein